MHGNSTRRLVVASAVSGSWATLRGSRLLIHPLCECELLSVEPGLGELDRREPAVPSVWPVDVVVDTPVL